MDVVSVLPKSFEKQDPMKEYVDVELNGITTDDINARKEGNTKKDMIEFKAKKGAYKANLKKALDNLKAMTEVFAIQDETNTTYSDDKTSVQDKVAFAKAIANSPFNEYTKLKRE